MKVARYTMMIGLLLAFVGMATLACASEAEPALDEAQMRSIVQDAVAKSAPAPQPQVSAEEIKSMVEEAMPMAPEPVSAAEIKSMVDSAMMGMADSQVSAEDIQSMVEKAVSDAAMEGASPQDLQAMVQSAVSAITADAVTSEDVQAAVSMAVMEAQKGMVTSEDVEKAMSSAMMVAAENSLTAEQIEGIVSKALEERAMMEEAPKGTIVFSDLNWTSAQVQNRIAQFIVEHGYGYPTDVIFGGTLPNFVGLQAGDIHVTLEIWLPNQSIGWEKAIEIGDVVSVGTSLVGDWQSTFVIPKYIADAHPGPDDSARPDETGVSGALRHC